MELAREMEQRCLTSAAGAGQPLLGAALTSAGQPLPGPPQSAAAPQPAVARSGPGPPLDAEFIKRQLLESDEAPESKV